MHARLGRHVRMCTIHPAPGRVLPLHAQPTPPQNCPRLAMVRGQPTMCSSPADLRLPLGLWMSISAGATFRSPVSTTGLRCCRPRRYAANSGAGGGKGRGRMQSRDGKGLGNTLWLAHLAATSRWQCMPLACKGQAAGPTQAVNPSSGPHPCPTAARGNPAASGPRRCGRTKETGC